jgi:hypothetical protein
MTATGPLAAPSDKIIARRLKNYCGAAKNFGERRERSRNTAARKCCDLQQVI